MADFTAFSPDWISLPGDTIADILEEKGWPLSELVARTDLTLEHMHELIEARACITTDTAPQLATALGSTVEFWLAREAQYRAALKHREIEDNRE